MKKVIDKVFLVIVILLIGIGVFRYSKIRQPYTHYKVYLDSKLMGTIKSKKELENYINSQAKTIRENVNKYQVKLDNLIRITRYTLIVNIWVQ